MAENSVPLSKLVTLRKETFNPANGGIDHSRNYIVLDTNHAYEGRIQFRGRAVPAVNVGSVKRPLKSGFVIVSRLRTYLRQVALIDDEIFGEFDGGLLCSTEFYVLAPASNGDIAFLVPFLLSAPVQKAFAAAEEGGHHPRIPIDVLLNLAVPLGIVQQRDALSTRVRESTQFIRRGERVMADLHAETAILTAFIASDDSIQGSAREPEQRPRRRRAAA